MTTLTPYKRGVYPTIEGNDRIYFDTEFTKIEKFLTQLLELLNGGYNSQTIASGAISIPASHAPIQAILVDTESAAATDDLATINITGGGKTGQIFVIYAADPSRTVVLKDGTGNLNLAGDMSLDASSDSITLQWWEDDGFYELSRSNNAA